MPLAVLFNPLKLIIMSRVTGFGERQNEMSTNTSVTYGSPTLQQYVGQGQNRLFNQSPMEQFGYWLHGNNPIDQIDAQAVLMDLEDQYNEKWYERQKADNSMVSKVADIEAAGLNPLSILGQGSISDNPMPSAPSTSPIDTTTAAPFAELQRIGAMSHQGLQDMYEPRLKEKQLDILSSTLQQFADKHDWDKLQYDLANTMKQWTIGKSAAELDKALKELDIQDQQLEILKKQSDNMDLLKEQEEYKVWYNNISKKLYDFFGVRDGDDLYEKVLTSMMEGKWSDVSKSFVSAFNDVLVKPMEDGMEKIFEKMFGNLPDSIVDSSGISFALKLFSLMNPMNNLLYGWAF